ncbi:MAG: B12-binding domain-containing radical SAM protein [ANME-2 cluster archaeon]|nr:B12-binding domain-containing radical SAM protein [ANME-2 cluster archaeon]
MSKKILLITPPYHCGVLESAGSWMPLGLVYVAGSLQQAGYEVEIYDAMTRFDTFDDIRTRIESSAPDVVACAGYTSSNYDAIQVLRIAKEVNSEIITNLGGIHATFCWNEILEGDADVVDYVIVGEGEETTVELLDHIYSGRDPAGVLGISYIRDGDVVHTGPRPFITDLDSLPAAWDLVEWGDYSFKTKANSILAVVSSSRGCTQKCTFCSQRLFWKETWRGRSAENFVAELEHLNRMYGVDVAMIADEIPTCERERWERILDLLIEKDLDLEILMETRVDDILRDRDIIQKYRDAGILHIYVGAESADQETLDRYQKDLKIEESKEAIDLINSVDIVSETSFVMGMPDETVGSVKATQELAAYYDADLTFFLAIAPWPYSDIYAELEPYVEVKDYSKYNLVEPVVRPVAMSRDELNGHLLESFRLFYMDKLSRVDEMSDFKRRYMIDVTKLLINDSYLSEQMKGGEMPGAVKKFFDKYVD